MKRITLFLSFSLLVDRSLCDFDCTCGVMDKSYEESQKCIEDKKKDTAKSPIKASEGRIVGGYDVLRECMNRPFLVLLRIKKKDGGYGDCMGTIINRKYVVTASHCFCDIKIGRCQQNNGKKASGNTTDSGHPVYENGTKISQIDPDVISRVTILIPGKSDSYNFFRLIEYEVKGGQGKEAVRKAVNITIHPEYVNKKRDQNDIALVEVDEDFDFSTPNVQPICLPPKGHKSEGKHALVTGYGRLYEADKKSAGGSSAGCSTAAGGPAEFQKCRDFAVIGGTMYETKTNCIQNIPSPTLQDDECGKLIETHPDYDKKLAVIVGGKENKTCYVNPDGIRQWCAVCVEGAKQGEAGFCDPKETSDSDYDDSRNDVTGSAGWGYCDKMCHSKNIQADKLQEAQLFIMSNEDCKNKSEPFLAKKQWSMRPMGDREFCVVKKKILSVTTFTKDGENLKEGDTQETVAWGGSDTCQGDSGGPLWTIEDKKAYIVGITNRGQGCARKDSYGIYAKVEFHRDWILKEADSGKCAKKRRLRRRRRRRRM